MRSRVRTPANFCIRFTRTGLSWALLGSPGAFLRLSWALLRSPGALLGSEIVQMACREPEPHAREDVMRSRVRTPANFCVLKAKRNQCKCLLSAPRASLGRPDSVCSLPRGGEIVQMICREPEPHAREDVMRSRVRTVANFCLLEAKQNRSKCLLSAPRVSPGCQTTSAAFREEEKSSKWHPGSRSLTRARMSCDHASGPLQISAY